ncbi:MAG: MBL fold metallo-hydrolase [Patescibacteria group bacterium]
MKVSFHGACREVTGSCILVETKKSKFLVDCGIFQGKHFYSPRNLDLFSFDAKSIDFVLLTHAHLDHCGRLPKLVEEGFAGTVYSTDATADFAEIMLLDSANVILHESQRDSLKPLYLESDVKAVMKLFSPIAYDRIQQITPEIKIQLRDAGHILGSAIFEVWITEDGQEQKLVFSGDLGNPPAPIVKDTEFVTGADLVFMESTYAGITHESSEQRVELLRSAIKNSVGQGGVLLIPSFALERTQEVLYEIHRLQENNQIPPVSVFVDSPLAIKATAVYKKYIDMYDEESRAWIMRGDDLFNFPGLKYTSSVAESKTINITPPPKVILAGSGMCTGGRMPHHLKFNLSNPKTHLLIIAYQVPGSLGRELLDGAKRVIIEGETIGVRAQVSAIGGYSSHADEPKLMNWVSQIVKPKPQKIFVVHGEEERNLILRKVLQQSGLEAIVPEYDKIYEI